MNQQQLQNPYKIITPSHQKSFRCYLRTSDMKCKIQTIKQDQSVIQLKQRIKNIFNLHVNSLQNIKLIINESQLRQQQKLSSHLHNNAIIHILIHSIPTEQQYRIKVSLKQPPINCPIYTIQQIPSTYTIKQLKFKIFQYYHQYHQQNQISKLDVNQLYLVYGGRVMKDENYLVKDYGYQEKGVLYVVNARIYIKEVTKEQADRRVKQVKQAGERQIAYLNYGQQQDNKLQQQQQYQQQQKQNQQQQQQQQTINIIQNIIDVDDQVYEQIQPNKQTQPNQHILSRSHKIIKRYDSIRHQQLNQQQQQLPVALNIQIEDIQQKKQDNNQDGVQRECDNQREYPKQQRQIVMQNQTEQKVKFVSQNQKSQKNIVDDSLDFKQKSYQNNQLYQQKQRQLRQQNFNINLLDKQIY